VTITAARAISTCVNRIATTARYRIRPLTVSMLHMHWYNSCTIHCCTHGNSFEQITAKFLLWKILTVPSPVTRLAAHWLYLLELSRITEDKSYARRNLCLRFIEFSFIGFLLLNQMRIHALSRVLLRAESSIWLRVACNICTSNFASGLCWFGFIVMERSWATCGSSIAAIPNVRVNAGS